MQLSSLKNLCFMQANKEFTTQIRMREKETAIIKVKRINLSANDIVKANKNDNFLKVTFLIPDTVIYTYKLKFSEDKVIFTSRIASDYELKIKKFCDSKILVKVKKRK